MCQPYEPSTKHDAVVWCVVGAWAIVIASCHPVCSVCISFTSCTWRWIKRILICVPRQSRFSYQAYRQSSTNKVNTRNPTEWGYCTVKKPPNNARSINHELVKYVHQKGTVFGKTCSHKQNTATIERKLITAKQGTARKQHCCAFCSGNGLKKEE